MFLTIYKRAMAVLMRKPLKLWGISLLSTLLIPLLTGLCGFAIPGLGIAISLLMTTSMTMVYLAGYRGKAVHTTQIFSCFKDWETIKRVTLGMSWMTLWIVLWSLIPIVGPFISLKRTYEYRLTPYILITEPDVALTEAHKESAKRTKGYKLQMWLSDFVIDIIYGIAVAIIGALAGIPYIGFLFGLVLFVLGILCNIFIYIGVEGYNTNPHEVGKYVALFFGVMVFILCGFEHCVADMFYFSVAKMWNGSSILRLIVITLGNAVGGVIFPLCMMFRQKVLK
jgi:hypothetical protein